MVASALKDRLEGNDSHHLHLIADILNCQGWDRTMTKTGRTENQEEMGESDEAEQSEGDEEEDILFADGSVMALMQGFVVPQGRHLVPPRSQISCHTL